MPAVLSRAYRHYIGSFSWKQRSRAIKIARGLTCERCGRVFHKPSRLQMHHRSYVRLGAERDEDLMVVCGPCHLVLDREREAAHGLTAAQTLGRLDRRVLPADVQRVIVRALAEALVLDYQARQESKGVGR